jgi:hypothetical protein
LPVAGRPLFFGKTGIDFAINRFYLNGEPRESANSPKALTKTRMTRRNPDMAIAFNTTFASALQEAGPSPKAGVVISLRPSLADRIMARRTILPSHELEAVPVRSFVSAVCTAEVEHADREFQRIAADLHASAVFYDDPGAEARFRLPHEARAGDALVWLSHLQAHDRSRRGPWARWNTMRPHERSLWLASRRKLLHGLIRAASAYRAARASLA